RNRLCLPAIPRRLRLYQGQRHRAHRARCAGRIDRRRCHRGDARGSRQAHPPGPAVSAAMADKTRYWEDIEIGTVTQLGKATMTKEEIIDFARKFDPQPFHIDEEAAK